MADDGLERQLQAAADDGLAWADLATVDSLEEHSKFGVLLNCTTRPEGRKVQARLIRLGARDEGGLHYPVQTDDEVLVIFPAGDPNRAVALAGLTSGAARSPSSADDDHVDLVHPGGLEVRRTQDANVEAVLLASLIEDLGTYLAALDAFMVATAPHTPGSPTVGAAATAFQTALTAAFGSSTGFTAKVQAGEAYKAKATSSE